MKRAIKPIWYLIIASILLVLLVISYLIRLSSFISIYMINLITKIIVSNTINLLMIASILIALYFITKQIHKQNLIERSDYHE